MGEIQPCLGAGRLPLRLGLYSEYGYPLDNFLRVFLPSSINGLPGDEVTIADSLKTAGYATASIGKWHLGSNPATNSTPKEQGFDYDYSILYSHEEGFPGPAPAADLFPPVPLTERNEIVEQPVQLDTVGARFVTRMQQFIRTVAGNGTAHDLASSTESTGDDPGPLPPLPDVHAGQPFFLYFAPASTHVPLYAEEKWHNASRRGAYGDAAMQSDAAIGAVMAELQSAGLLQSTVVFVTSDNGAWLDPSNGLGGNSNPLEGGSNAPFRGGKGSTWEGGLREPAVLYAPPSVLAPELVGTVNQDVLSALDLLPTFRELAGLPAAPHNVSLDGVSWRRLLANNLTQAAAASHTGGQWHSQTAARTRIRTQDATIDRAQRWSLQHARAFSLVAQTAPAVCAVAPGGASAPRAPSTKVPPPPSASSGMAAAMALQDMLASLPEAGVSTAPVRQRAARAAGALRAAGTRVAADKLLMPAAKHAMAWARGDEVLETVNPFGSSCAVRPGGDVGSAFSPAAHAALPPGAQQWGADGLRAAQGSDGTGPLHEWVWYWRDNVVYAARHGPFKAEFFTREGFGWEAPVKHDPPLLFHLEHDPAEVYPLNTTAAPYSSVVQYISAQAQSYAAGMAAQARPSRYTQLDWSLVPCCHKPYNATRAQQFWDEGEYGLSIFEECVCSNALVRPTA